VRQRGDVLAAQAARATPRAGRQAYVGRLQRFAPASEEVGQPNSVHRPSM
jgi:hypothetical protein